MDFNVPVIRKIEGRIILDRHALGGVVFRRGFHEHGTTREFGGSSFGAIAIHQKPEAPFA